MAGTIMAARKSSGSVELESGEGACDKSALETASINLIDAVHAKDSAGVMSAFKACLEACEEPAE